MFCEVSLKTSVGLPNHTFSNLFGAGPVMVENFALCTVTALNSGIGKASEQINLVEEDGKSLVKRCLVVRRKAEALTPEEQVSSHRLSGNLRLRIVERW